MNRIMLGLSCGALPVILPESLAHPCIVSDIALRPAVLIKSRRFIFACIVLD